MSLSLLPFDIYLTVLIRLVCALIFGGIIGFERANSKHDAGLRTHIIVCLGATSVMIVSQLVHLNYGGVSDLTRLGAQVISGIGFLGVGCIIVTRNRIRGLTTAAGLWTTACLGLVIGAGFIEVAATMFLLIMLTAFALRPLSLKLRPVETTIEVTVSLTSNKTITDFTNDFIKLNYDLASIKSAKEKAIFILHITNPDEKNVLFRTILDIDGVVGITEL
ncbi:MAG: MgtC/SapB family protein [Oscillospiraceae bacterium]|nr:MgtC/SapB family protein [Oscillospiraceae bacterium]MBQ7120072.1 MgtC/SapB family protein [Oscillospiraceae bacterium]